MIVKLTACLLLLASPTFADAGLPSPSEPLGFEAGTDLHQVLAGYGEATGQYLARRGKDELRQHRLTRALTLEPDTGSATVEALCRAAGLALWAEAHGEWTVLRVRELADLSLADARFVQVDELWGLEARGALPVSVVLNVNSLDAARLARSIQVPGGTQVLRPGGGKLGWSGLVVWGPAPEVAATARAFLVGRAPDYAPDFGDELEQVPVTPTFGVEDEVAHRRRPDEVLASAITLGERGLFRLRGTIGSVEELLRAYELATWRPVTYLGGYAQRVRLLSVPPFPKTSLSQDELDHWVQAVLAVHDLVGQPAQQAGRLIRPIHRYVPMPNPTVIEEFIPTGWPTETRGGMVLARGDESEDMHRLLGPHLGDMTLGVASAANQKGFLIMGSEVAVANALGVYSALNASIERGPAMLAVRVRQDAAALALDVLTRLHPKRDPAELAVLPWFGDPLVGAGGDEVLILAHPDQIALIADEVRALDR